MVMVHLNDAFMKGRLWKVLHFPQIPVEGSFCDLLIAVYVCANTDATLTVCACVCTYKIKVESSKKNWDDLPEDERKHGVSHCRLPISAIQF